MRYRFLGLVLGFIQAATTARGQTSYVGTVGGAPIELALNETAEGQLAGVYLYAKFGTPIALGGQLKRGVLTLTEKDARGKAAATLTIPAFTAQASQLTGTWRSLATGKNLPVTLAVGASQGELLQAEALKDCYVKLVLDGQSDGLNARVVAVKLFAKKTNQLVQELKVDCESHGIFSVEVGDYNFDSQPDFSVFESSYAGPNTSSLYFLYDPAKRRYVDSGYAGTSLEFDAKKRRVYERNSCCAGSSVITVEYKVVRNKLVELARHCYRWDEKRQELVARPASACQ